jgi:hypothetical protein
MRATSSPFTYRESEPLLAAGPAASGGNMRRKVAQLPVAGLVSGSDAQLFCR